jgi:hypothetical protein
MARKLSKRTIRGLMADWGRKGGSRATQKQKNAARANLKKTPNYQKHVQLAEGQVADTHVSQGERQAGHEMSHGLAPPTGRD